MFDQFVQPGKASFVLGGQWGSEGKGAAAAALIDQISRRGEGFSIITTNAGVQSGHTSQHAGVTRVSFHLPTATLISTHVNGAQPVTYLNAGSIIHPETLQAEMEEHGVPNVYIHPNAAVVTPECIEAERRPDSSQTKIASTRKGVGEALSRKVLRSGMTAKDHPFLRQFVNRLDLNEQMRAGASVLVEVPQGIGLSLDSAFYPHVTSRNCTVASAASDAGIHPHFVGPTTLVLRTYPIRVGNIVEDGVELGQSGGHYSDQFETSWEALGVKAEITTVTKRIRRVFTFSLEQMIEAMVLSRPQVVYLTFCDYFKNHIDVQMIAGLIETSAHLIGCEKPEICYQYGPSTDDVYETPQQER